MKTEETICIPGYRVCAKTANQSGEGEAKTDFG